MRPFREEGMETEVADDSKGSAAAGGLGTRGAVGLRVRVAHLLVYLPLPSTQGIWSRVKFRARYERGEL